MNECEINSIINMLNYVYKRRGGFHYMVKWNNFDTLASYEEIKKVEKVNKKE